MRKGSLFLTPCFLLVAIGSALGATEASAADSKQSIALRPGPQLFLDDYLIAKSTGIERKVKQPKRFLKDPVVTSGEGHFNWQPWFSVLHDASLPEKKRFRMWYNADVNPDPSDYGFDSRLAYLESADGIHWPGPLKTLDTIKGNLWVSTVFDEGSKAAVPAERYKLIYWYYDGKNIGPVVAYSPDGLTWKMHENGKPILPIDKLSDSWHAGYDSARKRYFILGKQHTMHMWTNTEGQTHLRGIRLFGTSSSPDFKNWSPLKVTLLPGAKDPGITEFYAVTGFHQRGDLIIAFLQILHDDRKAEGAPDKAVQMNYGNAGAGMGLTTLAWSRDGENWQRDYEADGNVFFGPNPEIGTWDHAMSWISTSPAAGDDVYLYYAGYRWGHKLNRSGDRQIGLVKIKQDRFVARQAGAAPGTIVTPLVTLGGKGLTINADAEGGEVRVQVSDANGKAIPGLTFSECEPIKGDALHAPVKWSGGSLEKVSGQPVHLEFYVRKASLYAFDLLDKS